VSSGRFGAEPRHAAPLRLSFAERERIALGLAAGKTMRQIARELGRSASTVSREVGRCGGRGGYRALAAERAARRRSRRPKPTKLERSPRLRAAVEAGLCEFWSPAQISARLRQEHPADEEMRISPETIYKALYVQSRGELRRQFARNLRSGRSRRRPRGAGQRLARRIPELVAIAARPPEVDERSVPGHWEGDLLMGTQARSAIATWSSAGPAM
jgi:IS30 family transposase